MSNDQFAAIRAHLEKHAGKERATFSIAGVKALLDAVDDLDRRLNEEQMQTANGGEIINDLKTERDEWQRRAERAENALPGEVEQKAHANYVAGLHSRIAELEAAGFGKPIVRRVERAPLVIGDTTDAASCYHCHGNGRHQGVYGGPGHPLCGYCGGTGRLARGAHG